MTGPDPSPAPGRILLLGATGTIGRATLAALLVRGHSVVCPVRPGSETGRGAVPEPGTGTGPDLPAGAILRHADVTDLDSLARDGIRGERFDALVSCLASRTGAPADAWAVEHRAQSHALRLARDAGITRAVLLSAICVQKPLLEFQKAKRAFEDELMAADLAWSIVRPTAFFKSLSGQVERVRQGKPFLIFGDGRGTACKPISDADLADYIAGCLDDPERQNRILPIGGPGPALTPRDQAAILFELTGRPPRFRSVPVALLDGIIATLSALGRVAPRLRDKAEFARIGRYYATESMLVLDPATGRYSAEATPEHGGDTLRDHYARLLRGEIADDRGAHAVF